MQLHHKFLVGLCASLLTLSLFGFGLFGSIYMVAGNAGPLKAALRDSGIYQTGVGDALNQSQKDNPGKSNEAIPTSKPEVRSIIEKSFPPSYIQGLTEKALDATYSWLHGSSPKIAFSIDVSDAKTRLADGMASYVQNRLNTLPVCTAADIPSGNIDAFNTPCVPPGFNKAEAVSKARGDILNGDFLKDAKFDGDSVKNSNGKTLSQQLQAVPGFYQLIMLVILMLGGLAVALSAGVVFLGGSWRAGLRRLGVIMAVVGAFSAVLGWLSSFVIHKAAVEFAKTEAGSQPLQQKVIRIAELLTNDLRSWLMSYGITLIVLGAAAITIWYVMRRSAADAEVLARGVEPIDTGEAAEKLPADKTGRAGAKPKLPEIKE